MFCMQTALYFPSTIFISEQTCRVGERQTKREEAAEDEEESEVADDRSDCVGYREVVRVRHSSHPRVSSQPCCNPSEPHFQYRVSKETSLHSGKTDVTPLKLIMFIFYE